MRPDGTSRREGRGSRGIRILRLFVRTFTSVTVLGAWQRSASVVEVISASSNSAGSGTRRGAETYLSESLFPWLPAVFWAFFRLGVGMRHSIWKATQLVQGTPRLAASHRTWTNGHSQSTGAREKEMQALSCGLQRASAYLSGMAGLLIQGTRASVSVALRVNVVGVGRGATTTEMPRLSIAWMELMGRHGQVTGTHGAFFYVTAHIQKRHKTYLAGS